YPVQASGNEYPEARSHKQGEQVLVRGMGWFIPFAPSPAVVGAQ
ncbi:unnamed protein product, partial [Urochloa humidicola]